MNTFERLTIDYQQAVEKLARSEALTTLERRAIKIYEQWKGGKAFNAGQRNNNGERVQKIN